MMNKNFTVILTAIIVLLAGTVIYLLAAPKENDENKLAGQATNNQPAATNKPTDTPSPQTNAVNYMQAQIPASLTEQQKIELKAGIDQHEPTELTFNMTGGSFFFTPNEIKVKQGDKLKIIFTNAGGTHNLIFDDFNVKTKTVNTGETDTIEFTADKKGIFQYYCGVGNGYHRQQGQIGVLIVN